MSGRDQGCYHYYIKNFKRCIVRTWQRYFFYFFFGIWQPIVSSCCPEGKTRSGSSKTWTCALAVCFAANDTLFFKFLMSERHLFQGFQCHVIKVGTGIASSIYRLLCRYGNGRANIYYILTKYHSTFLTGSLCYLCLHTYNLSPFKF